MDVTHEERQYVQPVDTENIEPDDVDDVTKVKRKRGRPPKSISPSKSSSTIIGSNMDQTITPFHIYSSSSPFQGVFPTSPNQLEDYDKDGREKRKRGRPRKYDVNQAGPSDTTVADQSQPKRWRTSANSNASVATSAPSTIVNSPTSINSVRSIPCFYRHCNFSYKRPNSNITEQSDRPLPLSDKFGSFTVRSCKKHCDQWKKMRSDGGSCEVCRGLNVEEGDMLQTYTNMFMKTFFLCDYCASAQAVPLQLTGAIEDSNARIAYKSGGEVNETGARMAHIEQMPREPTIQEDRRMQQPVSVVKHQQQPQVAAVEPYDMRRARRVDSRTQLNKPLGMEDMTEMEAFLEIERRKLADEVMFLRQQLEFEKSQKDTLQKQMQHLYHELETQHGYTTSLENHIAILQTRLNNAERVRSPLQMMEQAQMGQPALTQKFFTPNVLAVAPEDVALLSDIMNPTGMASPPKK